MDLNAATRAYVNIRDARSALAQKFDAEDGSLKDKLKLLEAFMLKELQSTGANSVRTDEGTVIRQEEIMPSGSDWDAFYGWIKKNDAFDFLERRIKKTAVKDYMEAHPGKLPPGVSVNREFVIRVRRA